MSHNEVRIEPQRGIYHNLKGLSNWKGCCLVVWSVINVVNERRRSRFRYM